MGLDTTVYQRALVWDQLFPAKEYCGTWTGHFAMLARMKLCGYDVVSVTTAYDPDDRMTALRRIGVWRRFPAANSDRYILLENADGALRAQADNRLAVGFHFQGTTPF